MYICLNISHIARLRHKRYKLSWWTPICSEEASNISNCWALGKKADMQPGAAINKSQIFSENIQHLKKPGEILKWNTFAYLRNFHSINDKFVKPWPSLFGSNATWRRNANGTSANFYSEREFLDFIGGIFTPTNIKTGVRHQISNNH